MNAKRIEKGETWSPTLWLGAHFRVLSRLLWRHRFAVDLSRLPLCLADLVLSFFHVGLGGIESVVYGKRVRRAVLREDPLFIVGHWRTGTTWLHQLLALDPRHGFPTTYDCLAPCHFLLTGGWLPRCFPFLLPNRRPMDAMELAWDSPQEDEFALVLLGIPSPYTTLAFPNRPSLDDRYLDFEGLSLEELESWKAGFRSFLRRLSARDPRRLVLKSPTHTGRVRVLRELFPRAQFVYLSRDPYPLVASTLHLWKTLYRRNGFQNPDYRGLEERVLQTYLRMQIRWETDRSLLPEGSLHEMRYEELVRDPLGEMRRLYERLNLGEFERCRPAIENYLERHRDYETNRLELAEDQRARVRQRLGMGLAC